MKSVLKHIVLGKKEFILSRIEYKRILLTGQLSLIAFLVCTFYLIFDLFMGVAYAWPYQLPCILLTLLSWWLNRNGQYSSAKTIFASTVIVTLFVFASVEPVQTGIFMFFIATSLGAFALFGYEERNKAFIMVAVSTICFLASVFMDFSLIPRLHPTEDYMRMNLIINFIICSFTCTLITFFLVKVNYHSEKTMLGNEKKMISQNQELTKINGELDRFVYSTSHDLRAPLSSIQGLINLTEMTESLHDMKLYVGMMKERVENLDKFITDISDYARNSRMEVSKSKIQLKKAVREVLENLLFYPNSDKVKVEMSIPEELYIHSDGTRLQMVLTNLVSNSFKYYDSAKATSYVSIKGKLLNATTAELDIRDNGIGIRADLLPKIFDMFFQAHEQSKGSGLGLYIVKETLIKLGGRISVESEPRQGSRFTIHLPVE